MQRRSLILAFLTMLAVAPPDPVAACVAFAPPVDGPITASFAPSGSYAGHWGVDFDTDVGTPVRAAESGWVSWAGLVVENLTITVHHGGGLRTSYSYLSEVDVSVGQWVSRGAVIGAGSEDHLHFSVRIGSTYIDPMRVLGCVQGPVSSGLRLVPVSYPAADATRRSRRDIRSTSHRSSPGRGDRVPPARSR